MPFLMASCCGWGFMPLTLLMHACLSSWEGDALRVLWTNLIKITLFNLFGMLGAYLTSRSNSSPNPHRWPIPSSGPDPISTP